MYAFIGSWVIAWLLGGGLILGVILYFVFFKKNSLASLAMRAATQAFAPKPTYKVVRKQRHALV